MRRVLPALLLVLLLCLSPSVATIFKLRNQTLSPHNEISWRFGIVTPEEQPQISFVYAPPDLGNGAGIVSRLVFHATSAQIARQAKVYVAVYHSDEGFRLGVDHLGKKHVCCTKALLDQNKCDRLGEVFMTGKMVGTTPNFFLYPIHLNESVRWFGEDIRIHKTGVYYYFLANCDLAGDGPVVSGSVIFFNPFGFLGVTEFPSLVFYSMATWIYVFAVMVWFMLCVVHYKDIFFLQIFIGVLFLVGFAEMAIWYGEYTFSNVTGQTSLFLVVTGVLTSTIKRTLSRTLVLVTSMGLGIMVTKIETVPRVKIVVLTVFYGLSSFVFDLFQVLERNEASGQKISLIFLMVVAVLDVIFYYWTFLSLSILLKQLSTRRNKLALAKMTLYKQLWWILIVTGVFSAGLVIAQIVLVGSVRSDSTWMLLWWLRFALWDIGYFLLLLSVAFLFRPMENNQRFAVSPEIELENVSSDAAEIASVPIGVDLILEDAGELHTVATQMKQH